MIEIVVEFEIAEFCFGLCLGLSLGLLRLVLFDNSRILTGNGALHINLAMQGGILFDLAGIL